jgi:hypothetical protein
MALVQVQQACRAAGMDEGTMADFKAGSRAIYGLSCNGRHMARKFQHSPIKVGG